MVKVFWYLVLDFYKGGECECAVHTINAIKISQSPKIHNKLFCCVSVKCKAVLALALPPYCRVVMPRANFTIQ